MLDVENSSLKYFEDYKKKHNAKRYQEDCDDFELREDIRNDLMKKQNSQCAYCERKIEKYNSHIEHIEPRDKAHKLECEYSNLVLSCNNLDSCGDYKDSTEWNKNFIHPVLNNPTKYFDYSFNGEILASNENANETIKFLNLNNIKLTSLRKNLALQLINMKDIDNIELYFCEFENFVKFMLK